MADRTGETPQPIPPIEGYHCFACGTANPIGLQMRFERVGSTVCSRVTLEERFVGWERMAHGGVVSALLDETMVWTILFFERTFCVTRDLRVRFLRPVPVGEELEVSGEIVRGRERRFSRQLRAELRHHDGRLLARAEADFALLAEPQLELLPESVRLDMEAFLAALDQWGPVDG